MKELHSWFLQNKREFPWRIHPTPYQVWVSEIMLQQTRAAVVVPYFIRWMEEFPDVGSLAKAPLEAIIKVWEGLGYYNRVRNLHTAARQIITHHEGKIPATKEELSELPGLGTYTTSAILSFGFHKRAAAVDGNVLRVLSRYLLIEENISRLSVKKKIEWEAERLLDLQTPWITAEALIELGATLCGTIPRCEICPLQKNCRAFAAGKALYLPIKTSPPKTTILHRTVLLLLSEQKVLLRKNNSGTIMADLYEFPYFERGTKAPWDLKLKNGIEFPRVCHTFTRYKAHLYPQLLHLETPRPIPDHAWVELPNISNLPFSSGHRKIAEQLCWTLSI